MPAGTETTIYVGGLYERVTKPSGVVEHKHYILANSDAIAVRTIRSSGTNDTRYLHKDHLGSVDTITDESGQTVLRLAYDAFGKRRNAIGWTGALPLSDWTSLAAMTHRGFTFHEHLDNVDVIHMNGRVYDPNIARFISADPFIQAPLLSQSLNRYSYVMNNPLSLVDPSGYSWLSDAWKKVKRSFKSSWDSIRHNINYIAAAVLIVVGVIADYYAPGSGSWFYATAAALIESPVQLGYSSDGPYIIAGYGGFGVETKPLGGGATSRAPPMTPPPGAVSLTMTGVVDAVKKWFGPSLPAIRITFDNIWDRNAKDHQGRPLYDKVETALTVAMTHLAGSLPPMPLGVRAMVSEGGRGSILAEGTYDRGAGLIYFVGANVKFVSNQTEMNSIALHELLHVIDTYAVPRSSLNQDAEWHKRIYRIQWDLRNDPRFYLDPGRSMYNSVYQKCLEFGGGCAK